MVIIAAGKETSVLGKREAAKEDGRKLALALKAGIPYHTFYETMLAMMAEWQSTVKIVTAGYDPAKEGGSNG